MVDFGSEYVSGAAPLAKSEGLSDFETAGASEANAYRGAWRAIPRMLKERLSGIALAKPDKRSPGLKDAVYGWALSNVFDP